MHTAREVRFWRLDDQVEVVRHQHPGRNTPAEACGRLLQEREKGFAICVVLEDSTLFVAAGSDVIDGAGKLDPKWSCHKAPRFPRS